MCVCVLEARSCVVFSSFVLLCHAFIYALSFSKCSFFMCVDTFEQKTKENEKELKLEL